MKSMLLSPFLLLLAMAAYAQEDDAARTISGSVLDAATYEPLGGTTVRANIQSGDSLVPLPGGAIARADGSFTINAPRGQAVTLRFSYVGYATGQVVVGADESSADILLEPSANTQSQIHVTATRRARSVEDACCRVESIHEEVQQHAPFSPGAVDVLRRYSSCTSVRVNCAVDNSSSIRLRGLEPTYINVRLDGMPAFTGLGTFYGLSLVPAHALQTIRISEGASSGLYGNGTISGVVDLETRPPTELPEITISGNVAGHGITDPSQADLNLSYTGMAGTVGLAAFGSFNTHSTSGEPEDIEREYDRATALLKGNIMIGDATELIVTTLLGHESREGWRTISLTPEHRERMELGRADLTMKLAHSLDDESELTAAGLLSRQEIDGRYGAQPLDAIQETRYLNLFYARGFGDHHVQIGGEIFSDKLTERSDLGIDYEIGVPAFIGQYQVILSGEWEAMASLRMDVHSSAGTIITPRGSLKYSPLPSMHMRLMAGRGFKGEALFNEDHLTLHGAYRWLPNPGFGFERSFTLNYDISYSFLMGDKAGLDANFNAYYTTIKGKAVPDASLLGEGILFYRNSSRPVQLTGMELQLRPTFGEHWSGSFALALIGYRMQGNDGVYRQIPLAPRANVDASLMFRDEGIGVAVEAWGSHIGSQRLPENPYGLDESKPYTLINFRAEKSFGPVAIHAGILNILNTLQSDTMPLSFETSSTENAGVVWGPIEGAEIFLGAKYTWGGSAE